MDKSEPALVPEWLRSSGNASNLSASALMHSDNFPLSKQAQYKSSLTGSDNSSVLERTTSAYLRRNSSSNGSVNLRFSRSFNKNHRDKHWDDKSDHSHPLDSILPSKFDKDKLLRSHSMISRKQDDTLSKKETASLTNVRETRQSNSNGNGSPYRVAGIGSVHGTAFEQDYPSLGAEEKQGSIVRVSSPVLTTGNHNEKNSDIGYSRSWKLTVTEAPVVTESSSAQVASSKQAIAAASATPLPNTGLNMAEALAQIPSRARTPPQSTAGMQRFEELAIRQAKLIPMTPMPKALVVSHSEKSKPKNPLHLQNRNHSPGIPDSTKNTNERKLQILKPTRELNTSSSTAKDSAIPTNETKKVNGTAGSNTYNSAAAAAMRYPSVFRPSTEKRSTFQVQSRNDFFKHLKKTSSEKSGESVSQVTATSVTTDNCDACVVPSKDFSSDLTPKLDEEEAAFLRSLGWDENGGEDEGLTEEEIRAFCEKYKTRLSSCKVHPSIQPILSMDSCSGVSSSYNSSSSDSECDC